MCTPPISLWNECEGEIFKFGITQTFPFLLYIYYSGIYLAIKRDETFCRHHLHHHHHHQHNQRRRTLLSKHQASKLRLHKVSRILKAFLCCMHVCIRLKERCAIYKFGIWLAVYACACLVYFNIFLVIKITIYNQ